MYVRKRVLQAPAHSLPCAPCCLRRSISATEKSEAGLSAETIRTATNYFINDQVKQQCLCHSSRQISAFMANAVKKKRQVGFIVLGS